MTLLQCLGGSPRRAIGLRESCVGGSEVLARFGEKMVFESRLFVGAESQCFGGSLVRET